MKASRKGSRMAPKTVKIKEESQEDKQKILYVEAVESTEEESATEKWERIIENIVAECENEADVVARVYRGSAFVGKFSYPEFLPENLQERFGGGNFLIKPFGPSADKSPSRKYQHIRVEIEGKPIIEDNSQTEVKNNAPAEIVSQTQIPAVLSYLGGLSQQKGAETLEASKSSNELMLFLLKQMVEKKEPPRGMDWVKFLGAAAPLLPNITELAERIFGNKAGEGLNEFLIGFAERNEGEFFDILKGILGKEPTGENRVGPRKKPNE